MEGDKDLKSHLHMLQSGALRGGVKVRGHLDQRVEVLCVCVRVWEGGGDKMDFTRLQL